MSVFSRLSIGGLAGMLLAAHGLLRAQAAPILPSGAASTPVGAAVRTAPSAQVFHARLGQTDIPLGAARSDVIAIDGRLDEAVWSSVPVLTGFSLYSPTDGMPAPDSTEVRVWYSADAIYFGIRAFEPHGGVRATLAERDRLMADDFIEIHIDPFLERRRAFVFVVNPFGIQADGTKVEGGGFIPGQQGPPGQADLSADYLWQSQGRVLDDGYEVEVRIPYVSLRFPSQAVQRWGLQFSRKVQHSGYETTWTPVSRGITSFIGQEGYISGLTGLKRGPDVLVNPELTNTTLGGPVGESSSAGTQRSTWEYSNSPRIGGNVRAGLGSNWVLNGTIKPDFSQVEADATQVASDQRFDLFYPERRPFFVEGADAFNVPNTLVYTRRIVQPTAAAKLTGRVGRATIAALSAFDTPPAEAEEPKALVNILRVTRDFSEQSQSGLLLSNRSSEQHTNTVLGADVRHVFGEKYYATGQIAASRTDDQGARSSGTLWEAVIDRKGKNYGYHFTLLGIEPGFSSDNGFVSRTGFVQPSGRNRVSLFGAPGDLIEKYQLFVSGNTIWKYADFFKGEPLLESKLSAGSTLTLRRGWSIEYEPTLATFAFDPSDYTDLSVPTGETVVPFTPSPRITSLQQKFKVATPQFRRFAANIEYTFGNTVDFDETSRINRSSISGSVDWRPDTRLRVNATYASTEFVRRIDGSSSYSTQIPRIKAEYQMTRAIFVRLVTQYEASRREDLRDWRTGKVLVTRADDGTLTPQTASRSNLLRADWLFAYRPSPGTVFFVGYGSSLTEAKALAFDNLQRENDGLFVKLSWVMRAGAK